MFRTHSHISTHPLFSSVVIITAVLTFMVGSGFNPEPTVAYTDADNPFGMNAHIYTESEAAVLEEMGVKWTRCDFNWVGMEPNEKGVFNWSTWDNQVTTAHNHGLQILAVLGYSPSWATTAPEGESQTEHWPPKNNEDYKDFVRAVVERYDGDGVDDMPGSLTVQAYELWNEPDIDFFKGTAEQYAPLLIAGYEGAKEADPDSVVLMGGLSRGGKDGDWIDRMLAAMKAATSTVAFDIANNHIYEDPDNIPARIQRFRNSFLNVGINVPHWYTEGSKGASSPAAEPEQARAVVKFFARYLANGVDKFFWYMLQYTINDYGEGFFYPDHTRKQGYYAYQTMSKLVSPRRFDPALKILTTELEQYGFTDSSSATSTLYLLWSADGAARELQLAYPAPAMDYITATGTVTQITPDADGFYTLTVSETPFYLREANLQSIGPAIRYPTSNGVIGIPNPNFEWETYTGAVKYSILLSQDATFTNGSTQRFDNLSGTNYQLQTSLGNGKWYAKVIAYTSGNEVSGAITLFTVDTIPPPAPQITGFNPSNLVNDGSLQIQFTYSPDPDTVQYNIYRSDRLENLGEVVHSTIKSSDYSFYDRFGSAITDRVYYYRATAIDAAEPPNESEPSDTYMLFFKIQSPIYQGWNLTAFPGSPAASAYKPVMNYMPGYAWDDGHYDYYDGNDAGDINPLKGYWIYNENSPAGTMSVTGKVEKPAAAEFQLKTGWNLVPNPYPFSLEWSDSEKGPRIKREVGSTAVDLSAAIANGWIRSGIFYYENGDYVKVVENQNGAIPAFRSFWIKAQAPCTLTLQP